MFRVSKPTGTGRYKAGQGRCQTCDIWIDRLGAHTKDGKPVTDSTKGWFCNCCNYRIRRNPRNIEYKAKIRQSSIDDEQGDVDLSYFNKRRAHMLRELGRAIVKKESGDSMEHYRAFLPNAIPSVDIEYEFGTGIDALIELAKTSDPPNKASMIAEFERVRHVVKHTPTRQDIEENSALRPSQYEEEFGSWEHLLERLGYDPWYRDRQDSKPSVAESTRSVQKYYDEVTSKYNKPKLDILRDEIMDLLKDDPEMLQLFAILEQNIAKLDAGEIKTLVKFIEHC